MSFIEFPMAQSKYLPSPTIAASLGIGRGGFNYQAFAEGISGDEFLSAFADAINHCLYAFDGHGSVTNECESVVSQRCQIGSSYVNDSPDEFGASVWS